MRSQGPFKIYDHAQTKGEKSLYNRDQIFRQAQHRFTDECEKIKESRFYEKEEFGWQKKKQDIIALHNQKLKQ
jgi:hypothetical protein